MKKILVIALSALAALFVVGCSAQRDSAKAYIGILKLATHPSYDAIEKGIEDTLTAQNLQIAFDEEDAKGDMDAAALFAKKFQDDKDKLVVGLGIPPSRALFKGTQGIPLVFAGVTDPAGAGLVPKTGPGDGRVSGVSDQPAVKEQLALLVRLLPSVKRIGMIYAGVKDSEGILTREVKQACTDLGLSFTSTAVSDSSQVLAATKTLVPHVDAVYVGPDSTVVAALADISGIAKLAKKPVITNDIDASKTSEVLFAWATNYYKVGQATGRLIADVLKNGPDTAAPVRFLTEIADVDFLINLDSATNLGVKLPDDLVKASRIVVRNGVAADN